MEEGKWFGVHVVLGVQNFRAEVQMTADQVVDAGISKKGDKESYTTTQHHIITSSSYHHIIISSFSIPDRLL